MARHEQLCFANALGIPEERITLHDLLSGAPSESAVDAHDAILVGGSGDYSVLGGHDFLGPFFDFLAEVVIDKAFPTFASCFGFQALVLSMQSLFLNHRLCSILCRPCVINVPRWW